METTKKFEFVHSDALRYEGCDLQVNGRVWGDYEFPQNTRTGRAFANGLMSDIGRRSLAVRMLSTAPDYEIHPNADPLRLGHVADLLHATITIGRSLGYSEQRIREIGLAVATGDLAHGPFSHLTDHMKEGVGGSESFHDERAHQLLFLGGMYNALRPVMRVDEWPTIPGHGIDEALGLPPWAERPSPGMNLDRLQYGADETLAKYSNMHTPAAEAMTDAFRQAASLRSIEIVEGEMVFKDVDDALLFAKGYMLLSEHWNSRLKRTADRLVVLGMGSAIMQRRVDVNGIDHGDMHYPLDYLVVSDHDMVSALQAPDAPRDLQLLDRTLKSLSRIGLTQFRQDAPDYLSFMMDEHATDYPALSDHYANPLIDSANIAIPDPKQPPIPSDDALVLQAPKYRYLDPLVRTEKGVVSLSEASSAYEKIMEQHRRAYTRHWIAYLAFTADERHIFRRCLELNRHFRTLVRRGGGPEDMPHNIPKGVTEDWQTIWGDVGLYPHMTYNETGNLIHKTGQEATKRALQSGLMTENDAIIRLDFTQSRSA